MAADRLARRVGGIRARTTLAACVVVAVALGVGVILVVVVLRRSLIANVDGAARSRATDVASLAQQGALPPTLAVPGEEDALVQVVDASGRVISTSANLEGQERITAFEPRGSRPEPRTLRNLPIGDEDEFRVVALRAHAPSGSATVYVAASLEQVEASVNALKAILGIGLPVLLALVGGTTWIIVGRALRPVEAIRAEVADISAHDLSRRVPDPGMSDEIGRLARTMNAMLDRLQTFTEGQRRFVADASHELQSPIASSRAELEVAVIHPEQTDWMAMTSGLLEDNQRMERLVRDLLFLARADDPSAAVQRGPVDLTTSSVPRCNGSVVAPACPSMSPMCLPSK